MIIDGMDIDTLAQFAYDSIMDNLKDYEEKILRQKSPIFMVKKL